MCFLRGCLRQHDSSIFNTMGGAVELAACRLYIPTRGMLNVLLAFTPTATDLRGTDAKSTPIPSLPSDVTSSRLSGFTKTISRSPNLFGHRCCNFQCLAPRSSKLGVFL